MKKAILVWTAIMTAGMLALAGCGKKETGQAGEYTNLADKESRKAVVGELEACGVTKFKGRKGKRKCGIGTWNPFADYAE